jgi:hypothetical protein
LWVATVIGILAIGLLVAGCGDEDSEASTVPVATFVKKANAICTARGKEITTASSQAWDEKGDLHAIEIELIGSTMVPALEAEVDEIEALGVPSTGSNHVEATLGAIEEVAELGDTDPEKFSRTVEPFTKAENMAKKADLDACPLGSG